MFIFPAYSSCNFYSSGGFCLGFEKKFLIRVYFIQDGRVVYFIIGWTKENVLSKFYIDKEID